MLVTAGQDHGRDASAASSPAGGFAMTRIKGHDYTWNQSWIEFKAPNAQGVYCLLDKDGKVIFIGKGKIRERLLRHWNQENSGDARIWSHGPAFFRFELTSQPAARETVTHFGSYFVARLSWSRLGGSEDTRGTNQT
jgi:hypothetical protein